MIADKHKLIADLKRVASDLGRTPTFQEFVIESEHSYHRVKMVFGQFSVMVHAAGLKLRTGNQYTRQHAQQRDREIVRERVEEYLSAELDQIPISTKPQALSGELQEYPTVVAIPDMHLPFVNLRSLGKIYSLVERVKPEWVVQLGDLYDFYAFSRFPRSHLVMRPDQEIMQARRMAEEFWKQIRQASKHSKCVQILGNHDIRPHKQVLASRAPELEVFFEYKKWFEFEGVETMHDLMEPFVVGDVAFHHGYASGRGKHRKEIGKHTVHGHTHELYLVEDWIETGKWAQFMWEMGCGYVGDPHSKVFNYTPTRHRKWKQGCGLVHRFGPALVCLE